MLKRLFPKIKDNELVKKIQVFLSSKWSMILIVLFTALSNLFSWEIFVFYLFTFIIILATLFSDDLLCLLPIACCGYFTFSRRNNPLAWKQISIFLSTSGKVHLWIIGIIIFIFAVSRFILDISRNKNRKKPKLLFGFLALGLAYVFAGIFSGGYDIRTIFFGFIQIVSLSFCYFYFYFTIDWEKVKKDYFAFLFMALSCLLSVEILGMMIYGGAFSSSVFVRFELYTGWGMYNNVGCVAVMCFPAIFYLATTKKNGWIFSLIGTINFLFVLLTQSRTSMLIGSVVYAVCVLISLIKSDRKEKLGNIIVYSSTFVLGLICLILFKDRLADLYSSIIQVGADDNGRIEIYKRGLAQFKESWMFGKGFYSCDAYQWGVSNPNDFLPPRYHNTVVQLLACGGVVALIAYLFHRVQTFIVLLKNRSLEKWFIMISIASLILMSLLDCHMFNFGPGFLYSALLLFAEKMDNIKKE